METENKPATETPQKKPTFKVYTRFSDKVTFIALVIGVGLSFLLCIGIYSYEFLQTQTFWEQAMECTKNGGDYNCLVEVRATQTINKDLLLSTMGASLSFIGIIFGFLSVTLYKAYKFE